MVQGCLRFRVVYGLGLFRVVQGCLGLFRVVLDFGLFQG